VRRLLHPTALLLVLVAVAISATAAERGAL